MIQNWESTNDVDNMNNVCLVLELRAHGKKKKQNRKYKRQTIQHNKIRTFRIQRFCQCKKKTFSIMFFSFICTWSELAGTNQKATSALLCSCTNCAAYVCIIAKCVHLNQLDFSWLDWTQLSAGLFSSAQSSMECNGTLRTFRCNKWEPWLCEMAHYWFGESARAQWQVVCAGISMHKQNTRTHTDCKLPTQVSQGQKETF